MQSRASTPWIDGAKMTEVNRTFYNCVYLDLSCFLLIQMMFRTKHYRKSWTREFVMNRVYLGLWARASPSLRWHSSGHLCVDFVLKQLKRNVVWSANSALNLKVDEKVIGVINFGVILNIKQQNFKPVLHELKVFFSLGASSASWSPRISFFKISIFISVLFLF